ncbi:MAG: thiamine pyrophosphate-binding protein [Nitrospira sp.]
MKVYQRLAQAFASEGVTATFGMMGDGNLHWLAEMHRIGVKVHEVRHEGAGLGMADGFTRTNGEPGVATTTFGPGVTQLGTALVTAARARSAIVAFCGECPLSDPDEVQSFDQARFAAACEAGFVRLASADQADEVVRKAFYLARLERRPIVLSCPVDVQGEEFEDDEGYRPSTDFFNPKPVLPRDQQLNQAADLICSATRPVIVVGRGAQWSGAGMAVLQLGDRIGALIATTLLTKTYLNECEYHVGISGLYASRTAMEMLHEADVFIGVGASLNRNTTENGYLYPHAKFIQIDSQPHVSMGSGRFSDIYVHADARLAIEGLNRSLAARSHHSVGYRTADVKSALALDPIDSAEFSLTPNTVDPRESLRMLDDTLGAEIGMLSGTGMVASMASMLMRRQRAIVQAGQFFGCIGQMLPVAMGAVVASSYRPLCLVDGDASFMMQLAEFETAVRYQMPLLVVVMNNGCLGPEYYKLDAIGLNADLASIATPDLGAVATAMGGRGRLVTDNTGLRDAAIAWSKNPEPTVLDVRISRTVPSLPIRRLHYGRDE